MYLGADPSLPLILQGAGTREQLNAQQQALVEAYVRQAGGEPIPTGLSAPGATIPQGGGMLTLVIVALGVAGFLALGRAGGARRA